MNWKKSLTILSLMGGVFAAGLYSGMQISAVEAAPAKSPHIYELRTYTTNEGKLDALHDRFSNHTNEIFVRNNMTLIGYWTPTDGDAAKNTLIYLIAHENREAAKKNWGAFGSDPGWKSAFAESTKDGRLVNNVESIYMDPTDYSPLR